jgi:competence protein ComEC
VAVHLQERTLWPSAGYAALVAIGLVLLILAWRGSRIAGLGIAAALTGAFLAGFGASGWRAALCMADALDPALEGRDVVVAGVVASLPQSSASGMRFRFDVESARQQGREVLVPPRLALGWYAGWHEDATLAGPQLELGAGQRWRWTVRLRRPHGTINPNGGDWELALLEQGVRASGYVRDGGAELLDRAAGHPVERLRQRVRDAIVANVPDRRIAGVIAALCVGDQGAIEREDWDLFRNTGVAHLMSISGLHVTMFAWLVGLGAGALWRRSERAALWLPTPQAARWGGFAAAAAYALFSGWGVPAQRTVWMLATVTLLRSGGVRWPWLLVLLVAAVVVTALDPWALLQAGFWLSFMAVGLLMVSERADARPLPGEDATAASEPSSGARARAAEEGAEVAAPGEPATPSRVRALAVRFGRHLRADLRTQVVATLGLTPLTLIFFQQVSVVGFAANLVAIPLVTLLITPLALAGALVAPLWSLAAATIQALLAYLGALAALPGAVWTVPVAPAWAQLAGIAGAVLLVLPLPWRVRALGIFLAVPLLLPARSLPSAGTFDLLALDVGQGTAVVVRTRSHLLVYDAGPQYARDSDAGQRVLLPVLRARGEAHIDRLVLSHRDSDHTGGARSVLTALPVGELLSSLEDGHPLLGLGSPAVRCVAGQSWEWDGVRFEVLRPRAEDYAGSAKSNALSCVVRVEGGGRSALLTGDIEKEQEADLVATHGAALHSDVLIAPHHGSRTSSTAAFLDAVAPATAVFQAGYRSRFGHPAPDVVARYRERGIEIVATPACGAWHAPSTDDAAPACERERVRRYWHHVGD